MSQKAKITKTILGVSFVPLFVEDDSYTYGTPVNLPHIAGGREFGADPDGEVTTIYADGVCIYSAEENHGYNITLTTVTATDDVERAWYGKAVDDSGGRAEYANNQELPRFALIIYEDTTDGIGKTTIYYDCQISERASKNGQTSDESGFDPQFLENNIHARPRLSDMLVCYEISGKKLLTELPEPPGTELAMLDMAGVTLSPQFAENVTTYTGVKTTTSGVITVAAKNPSAEIAIAHGGETIENGEVVTWGTGTVSVTVTNGEKSKTYTVTLRSS